MALRIAILPHSTLHPPIPTAARAGVFFATAKSLSSEFRYLGLRYGEIKAYKQSTDVLTTLFGLPLVLQERVLKVVDAGYFVRQSMGWKGLLKGAAQSYELGR